MKILVADDHHNHSKPLVKMLEYLGHRVDYCYGGLAAPEAIDKLSQGGWDVVVTDWHMPVVDIDAERFPEGFNEGGAAVVKAAQKKVKTIFVFTGEGKIADIERLAGKGNVFVKPHQTIEIAKAVQALAKQAA